eukprot:Skav213627  [mRNA]  locus=scaffold2986:641389:642846:- [translate_table: standard]
MLSRMEVLNPEVVRVTPAFRAFQQCALALRDSDVDLYFKSRKTQKISTFWSHSWHGSHWKKIVTLITIYNGPIAIVSGMFIATVMMILFALELLPGIDRGKQLPHSYLCSLSGFVVTALVIIFWRPQKHIFLDRICISQTDMTLKAQAIKSLAGLLKESDSMLILWDPTWTERLWCLFELAAFLQSKKGQQKELIVRPTFLGPMQVAFFLLAAVLMIPLLVAPFPNDGMDGRNWWVPSTASLLTFSSVVVYAGMSTLRKYFRDLDVMKHQLLNISFDSTRSSCCDCDHVSSTGLRMLCDRKIVKECLNVWFGSQEGFEETVRSEILEILSYDLAKRVLTTRSTLAMFIPFLWAFMDFAVSEWNSTKHREYLWQTKGLDFFLDGLSIWLLFMPRLKDIWILIAELTQKRPKNLCLEVMKNILASPTLLLPCAVVIPTWLASFILETWPFFKYDFPLARSGSFLGCMLLHSMFLLCLARGLRAFFKT